MTRTLSIDILDGLSSSVAFKGPCGVASTGNLTLHGEQTIDGVLTAETRVLVKDQSTASQNGLYVTSTGDWRRCADFKRNDDVVVGTSVVVSGGTLGKGVWMASFGGTLIMDTTSITFLNLTAVLGYASLASPAFTGNPTAPTPASNDNDTSIATSAFVQTVVTAAIAALINSAPGALDTLNELATALGNDPAFATTVTNALAACLKNNTANQTVAGGARVTVSALTNLSGQSITPDPGTRPIQKITNNGAGSILPGSNEGTYLLEVINASGAGAITTTGWTLKGDSFDTTTTSKFLCSCIVTSDMKVMTITKVA